MGSDLIGRIFIFIYLLGAINAREERDKGGFARERERDYIK